jgi:hypothetical protein
MACKEESVKHYWCFPGVAGALLIALMIAGGPQAGAPAHAAPIAPAVVCLSEPISMTLDLQGAAEITRTAANTDGDGYIQFAAPPFTTTASSTVNLTLAGGVSGTVGGTFSGSAGGGPLNGVFVTAPGGFIATPRGFSAGRVVLTTAQGTITGTLALNLVAGSVTEPYYPRLFNAFLASNDMSGSLAGKLLVVPLAGRELSDGSTLVITATGAGQIYTGAAPVTLNLAAARTTPGDRAVGLLAGDLLTQFLAAPLTVAANTNGRLQSETDLAGQFSGSGGPNGTFLAPINSLFNAPSSGRGWQMGSLALTDANTDLLVADWLGDLSTGGIVTNLSGQLYQVAGTGAYSTSMLLGTLSGTYLAGGFAGQLAGGYCSSSGPATATPTATATAASTATPSATLVSDTATPTATGVSNTATATATGVPGTATVTQTPCPVSFSDVTDPTAYYYTPVYYLACHGVISGYADGTFRPFNNTTRGQMAKIIVGAFGLPLTTPAAGGYTFSDNPPGSTFFAYVETAAARGLVTGYPCGGTNPQTGAAETCDPAQRPYYRVGNYITRGQLAKITVLAAQDARGWTLVTPPTPSFSDVPPGSTFYSYIESAVCHTILGGYSDGTYRPNANATRGQISKIVYYAVGSGAGCGPAITPTR